MTYDLMLRDSAPQLCISRIVAFACLQCIYQARTERSTDFMTLLLHTPICLSTTAFNVDGSRVLCRLVSPHTIDL